MYKGRKFYQDKKFWILATMIIAIVIFILLQRFGIVHWDKLWLQLIS